MNDAQPVGEGPRGTTEFEAETKGSGGTAERCVGARVKPKRGDHSLIYVVDDERVVADVVALYLERAGYWVRKFDNPVAAHSAFVSASPKPALLLVDYHMPEMDGLEFIGRCRAVVPGVKAVSISGALTVEDLRESQVQPDGFLRKPFTSIELLAVVGLLVG